MRHAASRLSVSSIKARMEANGALRGKRPVRACAESTPEPIEPAAAQKSRASRPQTVQRRPPGRRVGIACAHAARLRMIFAYKPSKASQNTCKNFFLWYDKRSPPERVGFFSIMAI